MKQLEIDVSPSACLMNLNQTSWYVDQMHRCSGATTQAPKTQERQKMMDWSPPWMLDRWAQNGKFPLETNSLDFTKLYQTYMSS